MSMKQRYLRWIAQAREDGKPIAGYPCPACGGRIETLAPAADDEPYDSMTQCPHCEELHFKVVWASGRVEASTGTGGVHRTREALS